MHPPRIPGFSYEGLHRYLLTFTTFRRARAFTTSAVVVHVLAQIRHYSAIELIEIIAYCFMPDHVHLIVAGRSERSSLLRFVKSAKQQSGYSFGAICGQRLWQTGFYDHVLRDEDATIAATRYVLANPVRAGLTKAIGEYPFAGSDVYSIAEICECVQMWTPPWRQG